MPFLIGGSVTVGGLSISDELGVIEEELGTTCEHVSSGKEVVSILKQFVISFSFSRQIPQAEHHGSPGSPGSP